MNVDKSSEPVKKVLEGVINKMQPLKVSTSGNGKKDPKRGGTRGGPKPKPDQEEKTEAGAVTHTFLIHCGWKSWPGTKAEDHCEQRHPGVFWLHIVT